MGGELTNPDKFDENVLSIYSVGDNSYGNITYLNKKELNIKHLFLDNFYQCFAIDIYNNLYSWGLNNYYQLANGKNSKYLFKTEDTNKNNFCMISSTNENTISKTIKNLFSNIPPIPVTISKIKSISCGDGFTIFLSNNGSVYSVGRNDKGQLGYELDNNSACFVDGIKCNNKLTIIEFFIKNKINIESIACGADFCLALEYIGSENDIEGNNKDSNKGIYSWGNNENHQLGIGRSKYKYYFNPKNSNLINDLMNEQKTKINKIICGWSHACILTEKDEIYIWGNPFKEYDKKYKDIVSPIELKLDDKKVNNLKIIDISSGFNHIAALISKNSKNKYSMNELYTFGGNEFGQLGYPTDEVYIDRFNKVEIPKSEINENLKITKVACGAYHTIVLMGRKLIYGFGQNNCKQIGNFKEEFITTPKKWNYIIDNNREKLLYDIKCSNGITCLLFKNISQIKEIEDDNIKNEMEIQVNSFETENIALKKNNLI